MADNLKDLIARLKLSKENSQASKTPKPAPKIEVPQETEEDDGEAQETAQIPEKVAPLPPKQEAQTSEKVSPQEQILMEIEMLQNNGRYRVELLHQLQEINKALAIIGGILLDLTGSDGKV